jgi:hypothetical protein
MKNKKSNRKIKRGKGLAARRLVENRINTNAGKYPICKKRSAERALLSNLKTNMQSHMKNNLRFKPLKRSGRFLKKTH